MNKMKEFSTKNKTVGQSLGIDGQDKKKSLNRRYKNSSKSNLQTSNSPRKRRI